MGSTAISAIILAGGRGERLGWRDKATLVLGGRTLVQRAAHTLASISDDVIVVRRADQSLTLDNARVVADLPSCQGVLAGIAAGLEAARHDWALIVACDMPFLNLTVIHHMIALASAPDLAAIVPQLQVGQEPLHALYHKRCLPSLYRALEACERRVRSFYAELPVRYVLESEIRIFDPKMLTFYNINTADELDWAAAQLAAEQLNDERA